MTFQPLLCLPSFIPNLLPKRTQMAAPDRDTFILKFKDTAWHHLTRTKGGKRKPSPETLTERLRHWNPNHLALPGSPDRPGERELSLARSRVSRDAGTAVHSAVSPECTSSLLRAGLLWTVLRLRGPGCPRKASSGRSTTARCPQVERAVRWVGWRRWQRAGLED